MTVRTRLPFLDLPLMLAPIAGPGTPELTAAVCNARAFGFLACAYMDPEQIADAAARVRHLTPRPFGMNLFIEPPLPPVDERMLRDAHERLRPYRDELGIAHPAQPPRPADRYAAQIEAVLRERPAAFSFTFGIPDARIVEAFRAKGVRTIGTATSLHEALLLEAAGVDALCAQGAEAGGHRGTFAHDVESGLTGTFALVAQIAEAVKIPVIASGGIMTGGGIAAAIALGASAAQLGTAFLLADEAATAQAYRDALEAPVRGPTVLTRAFSGRTARGIRNRAIDELGNAAIAPYPYQNALTRDIRTAAARAGRVEFLSLWAGEAYPLARAGSARSIVERLVAEMREASRDVAALCEPES